MVVPVADRVEGNMLKSLEFRELAVRDGTHVGKVCDVSEPETKYRHPVVHSPYRDDCHTAVSIDIRNLDILKLLGKTIFCRIKT